MDISHLSGGFSPSLLLFGLKISLNFCLTSPLPTKSCRLLYLYAPHSPCHLLHVHACVLSCFSRVWVFVTLWTIALQAPLSMGFSRQEYWSGLSCLPPGDLPYPGSQPGPLKCLLHWQAGSLPLVPPGKPNPVHTFFFFLNICLAVSGL